METIKDLQLLLSEQINSIYNIETEESKAIAEISHQAISERLVNFIKQRQITRGNSIKRLKEIEGKLGIKPGTHGNKAIKYMIRETLEYTGKSTDPNIKDAELVAALKNINGYKIAAYETALAYAKALGFRKDVTKLIEEGLYEAKAYDKSINRISKSFISEVARLPIAL